MVKQTIQIFARLKPTKAKTGFYELDDDDDGHPRLTVTVPRDLADGFINNKKENYKFRFQKVFDQNCKQDEVFETVSQPVIDNVLQGYNGTIFAYGQTGSGKTFTITGGAESYMDRGIIPRSLSYIFAEMQKSSDLQFTLHVSYLEIYNESGYDLLDPKHEAAKLEDLPKVSLMEDTDQNIHLKNLSVHQANNEEEALNLLFLGDTNRMIAETPMNQASTRSHCIFTIHLTSRESTSATIRRAKLHLVDLAGSERVSKSGVNGMLLTEAKYINLSLHYLEQVIIALSEKNRQHIPYRNSLMTSVLRDSLGGNCMTTMIATCSVEKRNIDESISTCRFAQRVAMIKNDVTLNEELDPKLMILKLKAENQQLKEEIQLLTGEQRNDELTEEDMERCDELVKQYLNDTDTGALINVGSDTRKIQQCFRIMKKMIKEKPPPVSSPEQPATSQQPAEDTGPYRNAEVNKLKDLVIQRDNEINILVGMLKKEKKRASDALTQSEAQGSMPHRSPSSSRSSTTNGHCNNVAVLPDVGDHMREHPPSDKGWMQKEKERLRAEKEERTKANILGDMSMGRQEAFEIFRRDYEHNGTIDEHKSLLKQRYTDAKRLGEQVNMARMNINQIKSQIEQRRLHMAMQGFADTESLEPSEGELKLRDEMEQEKTNYKEAYGQLKTMKTEIEHLQHLLEKSKVQLLKDFELWWAEQVTMAQKTHEYRTSSSRSNKIKSAWRTPPVTPPQHTPQHTPIKTSIHSSERLQMSESDVTPDRSRSSHNYPQRNMLLCSLKSPSSDDSYTSGYNTQNTSSESQQQLQQNRSNYEIAPIPMTGDARADADIMAFVKARQNILKRGQVPR